MVETLQKVDIGLLVSVPTTNSGSATWNGIKQNLWKDRRKGGVKP